LYTFHIGENTGSYLNQHLGYHMDMIQNSNELSFPFSVNPIIINLDFLAVSRQFHIPAVLTPIPQFGVNI